MFSLFLALPDFPKIPDLDIAFALSATATDADSSFRRMKDTIKSIIDRYGTGSIRYAVIVFGRDPSLELRFSDKYPSDNDLKMFFNGITRKTDGSTIHRYSDTLKNLSSEHV